MACMHARCVHKCIVPVLTLAAYFDALPRQCLRVAHKPQKASVHNLLQGRIFVCSQVAVQVDHFPLHQLRMHGGSRRVHGGSAAGGV